MNKEDFETQCKLLCEYCSAQYPKLYLGNAFDGYPNYLHGDSSFGHAICQANSLRKLYEQNK